jgi:hypothetical protein
MIRALYQSVRDPAALAMLSAYAGAGVHRSERCQKPALIAHLREQQRLRSLGRRAAEARGKALRLVD